MFNGKSFNEKFLLTRKYYDFVRAINCTSKLTCVCACTCACDHTRLREQYEESQQNTEAAFENLEQEHSREYIQTNFESDKTCSSEEDENEY